jgi:hypothetical protein
MLEIGYAQGQAVKELFEQTGTSTTTTVSSLPEKYHPDLSEELSFSAPPAFFRICSSSSASLPTSKRSLTFSLLFRKRNLANRIIKKTGTGKKIRIMSNSIGPGIKKAKILFIIFRSFPAFSFM